MAQSCKRKTKASVSISSDSDICSLEGKKACNSPRSEPNIGVVFGEDDQVLEALNMTEKIATQLERIFEMLAGVESRLQNLEGIFERFSALKKIGEKTRKLEGEVNDLSKSMEFANAEIEDLKKNDKENEVKIKELEDKILYQEVYNRRENLRFFGFPESADGAENTHEVQRKFLSDELEMENAADIEFQRAHRIGKKKTGAKLDW